MTLTAYRVEVISGTRLKHGFEAMSASSFDAIEAHQSLAGPGEKIIVQRLDDWLADQRRVDRLQCAEIDRMPNGGFIHG